MTNRLSKFRITNMLERRIDIFTEDDRKALRQFLGLPPFDITSDAADDFVRCLPIPEIKDSPDVTPSEDLNFILNGEIFMKHFLEDYFSFESNHSLKKEAQLMYGSFYIWQESCVQDFINKGDPISMEAADIIFSLTLQKIYEFTNNQEAKYREVSGNVSYGTTEHTELKNKTHRWAKYRRISMGAANIEKHQFEKDNGLSL